MAKKYVRRNIRVYGKQTDDLWKVKGETFTKNTSMIR